MRYALEQYFGSDGGNVAHVNETRLAVSRRQAELIVFLNIKAMCRAKVLHKKTRSQKRERNTNFFQILLDLTMRREDVELRALQRQKNNVRHDLPLCLINVGNKNVFTSLSCGGRSKNNVVTSSKAVLTLSRSPKSNLTTDTLDGKIRAASFGFKTAATIWSFSDARAESNFRVSKPTLPVSPVTRIFIVRAILHNLQPSS